MRGLGNFSRVGLAFGFAGALTLGLGAPVGASNPYPFGSITHTITLPDTPVGNTAHLYFVQGIPGAGPLDLCSGTDAVVANVAYGDVALAVFPSSSNGLSTLVVRAAGTPACTGAVVATYPAGPGPAPGLNASIIANVVGGVPNVYGIDNDSFAAASGQGRLEVFNAANAPDFVVKVDGNPPPAPGPGNPLMPGGFNYSVDLPAGSHDVTVTTTDGTVVKDFPGTTISDGVLTQIFLVGDAKFTEPTIPTAPPAAPVTASPKFTG